MGYCLVILRVARTSPASRSRKATRKASPVTAAPMTVGQNQSRHSKRSKGMVRPPPVSPRCGRTPVHLSWFHQYSAGSLRLPEYQATQSPRFPSSCFEVGSKGSAQTTLLPTTSSSELAISALETHSIVRQKSGRFRTNSGDQHSLCCLCRSGPYIWSCLVTFDSERSQLEECRKPTRTASTQCKSHGLCPIRRSTKGKFRSQFRRRATCPPPRPAPCSGREARFALAVVKPIQILFG